MKHFFSFIAVLLFAIGAKAQSEEPVIITAPDTVLEKTAYTLVDQGITIEVSYGSAYPATHSYNHTGYTYFACLANSSIKFSATQAMKGIAINGWVKKNFSASSDKGVINYLSDEYDDSTGEPVLTISDIDATSVTISCDNQLRCFSVEVYFSENPGGIAGDVMDTVRFTAVTAQAADYSNDETFSSEGSYSYWLNLVPATTYPQVWLDMYSAVKGDLSGSYSLYDYNVGDYTYVQLSASELDYEYVYDQAFTITKTANGYHVEGYVIADNDVQYEFVYDGPIELINASETDIEQVEQTAVKTRKILHNGQLRMLYDGRTYDVQGREVKD